MWISINILFSLNILVIISAQTTKPCISEINRVGICLPSNSFSSCPLIFNWAVSQGNCTPLIEVCCSNPASPAVPVVPQVTNFDQCGFKGNENRPPPVPGFTSRIFGGTDQIPPNEFCWQVHIFLKQTNTFVGGGSLVTKNNVLTSATVAKRLNGQPGYVILGDIRINASFPTSICKQVIDVTSVKLHPNYVGAANFYYSDVAVLQLIIPATLDGKCVCTVCLPSLSDSFDGKSCTVTGIGAENPLQSVTSPPIYTETLKKVDLPVIPQAICQLQMMKINPAFRLDDSQMCAGGMGGKDACRGDGGGPLSCQNSNNKWVVAGIVSVGFLCGVQGVPGIFSRITSLLPFIQQNIIL